MGNTDNAKKVFTREMYTNTSELGRMKLLTVKENLYEASTKVIQYTIEMYSHKELKDWLATDLREKAAEGKAGIPLVEVEQNKISLMDITNSITAINQFVEKKAYKAAELLIQSTINEKKKQIEECEKKEEILNEWSPLTSEDEVNGDRDDIYSEKADGFEDSDEELEDDDDDENGEIQIDDSLSSLNVYRKRIFEINDEDELEKERTIIGERKEKLAKEINSLRDFNTSGKNKLELQRKREKEALDNLRTLRNSVYAHKTEDEVDISDVGSWEPEAGPLYKWADEIKKYIEVIDYRYLQFALFDEFYATKEFKNKFDSCKIFVQKQINSLYVNQSSVTFEFAGELYDKEGEDYNFKKLIESMAQNWETGIRYLTVVTSEDIPEMNMFFKECLSGTNKFVDQYLINRNKLRELVGKNSDDVDYVYFCFLYGLNPELERLYWKTDTNYSPKEFARNVLYPIIRCRHPLQLRARLEQHEKFFGDIDVVSWSKKSLLSSIYYTAHENEKGVRLSASFECAIVSFMGATGNQIYGRYKKAVRAAVLLYFYMTGEYAFWFGRKNGSPQRWLSLDDARRYMENASNFRDYSDICSLVDELSKSEYFKAWKKEIKNKISEVQPC